MGGFESSPHRTLNKSIWTPEITYASGLSRARISLRNMRGAGEPTFEYNFLPGTDIVGEILAGPYEQEIFELEIAARLRGAL